MADENRVRVCRTATLETGYPPEQATLLFSAEGERLWLGETGWDPAILCGDGFGQSDVFVQEGAVFVTTAFDAARGVALYARVLPGTSAGTVEVTLVASERGSSVQVRYTMTSLGEAGDATLSALTEAVFAAEIARWQTAIEANAAQIEAWFGTRA